MRAAYHEGELAVQVRAGAREMAERVGRSIGPFIPPPAAAFLAELPMAVVGAGDGRGRVWASLLAGAPGFMRAAGERLLRVRARFAPGDRLAGELRAGNPVGLLALEPETRRRMRLNGSVEEVTEEGFAVRAEQVYSNCPKYITRRVRRFEEQAAEAARVIDRPHTPSTTGELTPGQRELVAAADTFFIASLHGGTGADAS